MTDRGLLNLDWGHAVLAALANQGVQHVVLSPGSRSTPLALAANRHEGLTLHVVLDERVAGFTALGLARATGRPVALVCTSGTAAANYHPALAEAATWGVPLVALTADRPPRLRGLGAAQTIDQVRLFGPTTAFAELPVPEPAALEAVGARVALALAEALTGRRGPVHLNVPFDEPLAPSRDALAAWRPQARPAPRVWAGRLAPDAEALAALRTRLAAAQRPLVVAGPGAGDAGAARPLLDWAAAAGVPVIADVGSGLRGRASEGGAVLTHADLFVRPPVPEALTPDLLVLVGRQSTSKAVSSWCASLRVPAVALWPDAAGRDPEALADTIVVGDVGVAFASLGPAASAPRAPSWLGAWQAREAAAALAIAEGPEPVPPEAAATRAAITALPEGGGLVLSNSLPIRHADAYAGLGPAGGRVVVLRGANGIDGVTAVAQGAARAWGVPTLLVTGDLAFLHDLGALVAARDLATPLVVLVLDNDGGAIFHHLPIAEAAPDFETLFGTPQARDLPAIARALGATVHTPSTLEEVHAATRDGLRSPGLTVLVFPCDRRETVALHRAFIAGLAARSAAHA
ncbi:MAG: 2-succinyl-5-enolpyruvyl-6-hydroxy-3-cyclohexene-1-carboxylic-acid synthase [Candidatus Sericytochromatia bacterium]|nr:2-succinyl-5-enolpyruvyl-6-hydroxy-3-cyclohexene-1-carboxylic-acid synthase [Candidatus Sericytochromatia bacterium]